jgi:hypothetical protein
MTQQWGPTPTQSSPQPPELGHQPPPPPRKRMSRRQKTLLLPAGLGLAVFAIAMASCSVETSTEPPTPAAGAKNAPRADKVSQGLGTKDASADVRIVSFQAGQFGQSEAKLEITNHSNGTSDYYIEVAFEDGAGPNIDWGNAVAQHVEPGQKAIVTTTTFKESAERVKITEIQRTASS